MRINSAFIIATAFTAVSAAVFQSDYTNRKDLAASATSNDCIPTNSKRMDNPDEYKLQSQLNRITNSLMQDVQYLEFSFDVFKSVAGEMSKELSQIDLSIKQLSPPREDLLKKLEFTQRVFHEMSEAVNYESLSPPKEDVDYTIAMKIVELNLNLLTFFDYYGNPSPNLPIWRSCNGHVSDLRNHPPAHWCIDTHKRVFKKMCSKFGQNGEVDVPVRALFEQQVDKAKKTFDLLYAALDVKR